MFYFYTDPVEHALGIHFQITDENSERYNFVVCHDALEHASAFKGRRRFEFDYIAAFNGHIESIHMLAEKMIEAGVRDDPIMITTDLLNR